MSAREEPPTFEVGDEVIIIEGDFKGKRGIIQDTDTKPSDFQREHPGERWTVYLVMGDGIEPDVAEAWKNPYEIRKVTAEDDQVWACAQPCFGGDPCEFGEPKSWIHPGKVARCPDGKFVKVVRKKSMFPKE